MLRKEYGDNKEPTIRTGLIAKWDVPTATVTVSKDGKEVLRQKVGELGESMQEIIVAGGLESWVRNKIA